MVLSLKKIPYILPYSPNLPDSSSKCPAPPLESYPRLHHTPFYDLPQIFQWKCPSSELSSYLSRQALPCPLQSTFHTMAGPDSM